ncbi:rhomboid family intramembrane serine protease [Leeuwenhoekiella sp. A16]|uniref:rhomboid family intramembrane serine protease n=1 Tax=unclassified Leeuwenhoekiella TaxID=2615029 RepID=UPI003A80A348
MNFKDDMGDFKFTNRVILYPVLFVLLMWLVFWAELKLNLDFTSYGVLPRTLSGLRGIFFAPFIHANLNHLLSNSLPVLLLMAGLFYFYQRVALTVICLLFLLTGIGTWSVGREAYHIGASGIVYGLASFLFFKGIWARHYRLTAFSLVVVFIYGSLVWGVMPIDSEMSWEGHLSGFLSGFGLAFLIKNRIAKPKKYDWEKEDFNPETDPFLRQFDEQGNFIDPVYEDESVEDELDD